MRKRVFSYAIGLALALAGLCSAPASAQTDRHVMVGIGALYEHGLDATLSFEKEDGDGNAWEFFANGYLKYEKDPDAGHYTKDSFWKSYNTWALGVAYKPCVTHGRNHKGNVRIGASGGSDKSKFVSGIHVGYEHTYYLSGGWALFWQVKEDVMFHAEDRFRTGVELGIKVPM